MNRFENDLPQQEHDAVQVCESLFWEAVEKYGAAEEEYLHITSEADLFKVRSPDGTPYVISRPRVDYPSPLGADVAYFITRTEGLASPVMAVALHSDPGQLYVMDPEGRPTVKLGEEPSRLVIEILEQAELVPYHPKPLGSDHD